MARKSRKKTDDYTYAPEKIWRIALYARLSRKRQEHESIETQIEELKNYIQKHQCFNLIDIYADNGYSGANFNRPDFERLMDDIRNRQIDCIIVKDLSRFAREHIGAEDYLNNIFPFLGVRFIAINDCYDNINIEPQEYFLASFKNLANAHFAKETSRKVSVAKKTLQEQGKFIGSKPPYGYKRDPIDKYKLIIDDETAPIVREIFQRYADGELSGLICKDLNERKLKKAKWNSERLNAIMRRETYIGTLTQRFSEQALYKNEPMKRLSKNQRIRIENSVPPIIEGNIWDKVQKRINAKIPARKSPETPDNIYRSYIFCKHCGIRLPGNYVKSSNPYFFFRCQKCAGKHRVRSNEKKIGDMIYKYLHIENNVQLTREIIINNFDKIIIAENDEVILLPKGGE